MKRPELAKEVGVSDEVVKKLFATIKDKVKAGDKVEIPGFGSFFAVSKAATTARNPKTGETVNVPAKRVPKFKVSSTFKSELN